MKTMFSIDSWIRFILTELYAVGLMAFVFRRQMLEGKRNIWLKILLVMLAMYLAHLFYVLLTPTYFFRRFRFSVERVNLVPFLALRDWLAHPFNFFGNVLLFMPIGFFEVLLHPADTRRRQLVLTAAASAGISLFVEIAQCFNYRVPDVDDIVLNTVGGLAGALLCMLQQKIRFDQTRIGRVLLPRIPRTWRRHMLLNRFCVLLVVSMEAVMFTVNYIVTIPKPKIRVNSAAQTETAVSFPESGAEAVTAQQEPEAEMPAESPQPTSEPRIYHTSQLELEAQNILLVRLAEDAENEFTVFAEGSGDLIYPASTLKMLTALTVLDIAQPEEKVKLGTEIYIPPLDASRASLEYGMTLTIRDLLEGLLLPSGADAAYALGVYCGRQLEGNNRLSYEDAVQSFVAEMNRKAVNLGAEHTTAKNVVGLDAKGQLTTAEDILKIAKAFLAEPLLAEICGLPTDWITCEEGKSIALSNTNMMLHTGSPYFNGDVAGVKTGTTNRAGNCLVSIFSVQKERYLCIVMNSSYDGRFTDTQKLYEICAGG